jgi:transposase
MIKIEFSQDDKQDLYFDRYHHPHPRVQLKIEALWLKSLGYSHKEICKICKISKGTLCSYLKQYLEGGIDKLKEINFRQPESELEKHTQKLKDYFHEHPPATVKEAMAKIEELTEIKRCETQTRMFMKKIGMQCRKVGMLPAKADPDKQESFKKNKLEPVLAQAKNGEAVVYFMDAAHFVLAPFLGYLWSFCRIFIKAPAGRKRFNVLGALDAINHQLITVTNDSYINSYSICELFWKLRQMHPSLPITVILDNAKYQKCKLVFACAESLNLNLLYLPSYSPNLNLIERLWKFLKKKALYSKYYSDFDTFKNAISNCLAHTHDIYKDELDSLLMKFQSFQNLKEVQVVNV